MTTNNAQYSGQAEPTTGKFGREKWIKDTLLDLWRHTVAVVVNLQVEIITFR